MTKDTVKFSSITARYNLLFARRQVQKKFLEKHLKEMENVERKLKEIEKKIEEYWDKEKLKDIVTIEEE